MPLSATVLSGKNTIQDWNAKMIKPDCDQGEGTQSCYVQSNFSLNNVPDQVVLIASALGLYEAYINGQKVGSGMLTPGWTCYDDRIAYQTYDVTPLLVQGDNEIKLVLSDGWYRSQVMWESEKVLNCWGDQIAAFAQLMAGDDVILATNSEWQSGFGPVTKAGIYYGEDYDARQASLEAHSTTTEIDFDTQLLVPHEVLPVSKLAALPLLKQWNDDAGYTIFDFGQNCSAVPEIVVSGDTGARIEVDFAEVLGPDGNVDRRNYRHARASIHYTLAGSGVETYCPSFTFVGYRYARVKIVGNAILKSIQSYPISSITEQKGGFECDNALVNRLVLNTLWSQRSNFVEVPTDCPQRDERLGWTGDAQVFSGTACWLADAENFLGKYMNDVMADQRDNGAIAHFCPDPTRMQPHVVPGVWAGSTGWGDAITVIPWQLYKHYGNKQILTDCFPAMLKWLDYLWSISDGPIPKTNATWGADGFTFGDWLQPIGDNRKPQPTIADDCLSTIYHYISTTIALSVAKVLAQDEQVLRLEKKAQIIRDAFIFEYFSASGRLAHNDQTSYALAFMYDLVPQQYKAIANEHFRKSIIDVNYKIGTGFLGTPDLIAALVKTHNIDLAEKVLLNEDVPGWLYQVKNGATTIWERWDAIGPDGTIYDPDMNSYNHYAYGAVCQTLFEVVSGIAPSAEYPGFKQVIVSPAIFPALKFVSMWHESKSGKFSAQWAVDNDCVNYQFSIPESASGLIKAQYNWSNISLNGKPISIPPTGLMVGSGKHHLTFTLSAQ